MALELYYTDRIPRTYTLNPVDAAGQPATITAAKLALVPRRTRPTSATTWTTVTVTANKVAVDWARAGATDTSGAQTVPDTGGDVYIRGINGTYDDAEFVESITAL